MSEIEKMYENVGVKKEVIPCPAKYYGYDCTRNNWDDADCSCDIECYPLFTAEKQLLLLQLLTRIEPADYFQFFFYEIKQEWVFRLNMLTELSCESAYIYESRNTNFDECIAGLINIIWQNLTEAEKQQVKGILE